MIVKNEKDNLQGCFDSVCDQIGTWTICDTGSTDGTQDFIKEYFASKGIKGNLIEEPWVNFGANRTSAFRHARGTAEYLLVIDASDRLSGTIPNLGDFTSYHLEMKYGSITFPRCQIFKGDLEWKYVGVLHEYPCLVDGETRHGYIKEAHFIVRTSGKERNGFSNRYAGDAEVLTKALVDEPNNSRYQFYLAQSYRDSGQHKRAVTEYLKRASMGGFAEEVYVSYLNAARLSTDPFFPVKAEYLLRAFEAVPRLEALHAIMVNCRSQHNFSLGFKFGLMGIEIDRKNRNHLFTEVGIYDYLYLDELSIAAHYNGFHRLAVDLIRGMVGVTDLHRQRIENNAKFFLEASNKFHVTWNRELQEQVDTKA